MKKYFIFIMTALAGVALTSCSNNNKKEDKSTVETAKYLFTIKKATVHYNVRAGILDMTETFYFDDYGKKMRIEHYYTTKPDLDYIEIFDETAGKAYNLQISTKKYKDENVSELVTKRLMHTSILNESNYQKSNAKRTTEVVAGKECVVYTQTAAGLIGSVGLWNSVCLLQKLGESETTMEDVMRATSIAEDVPTGIFDIPADYAKE
ncbi:MAG: hypothetical protein FWF72_04600 [Paludibacter sp.]|nr:hypothetical protein [Paludibacter sp.]